MKTKISQSLIRDMLSEDGYCGHYLNEVYNNGFSAPPTDAMVNGLFFEQEILGATARPGEVIELPKSKAKGREGQKLQRELDLEKHVEFAKMILKENKIVFENVQVNIERQHLSGHIDAVGTYNGIPYLFDLKYTGMSYDQWDRELKWGNISGHFTLQARQYQALIDKPLPFMFLVFGSDWCRFFQINYSEADILHHVDIAAEALETFNSMDYRSTEDSRLCFQCWMRDVCKVRNHEIQIEEL